MAKSIQAQAAAQIRSKLKDAGINASVTSFSASMCEGVNIYCNEEDLAQSDKINAIANPYKKGHFNSMEDIYEYSNTNGQIPQVMFVQVSYCG